MGKKRRKNKYYYPEDRRVGHILKNFIKIAIMKCDV
jgi:hypothetical protein